MKRATDGHAFDLNIEKVLEHWNVSDAIREFIANALDEQRLTGTAEPQITRRHDGAWTIEDFGRGLRYRHLTQNENSEKAQHPEVIGQFGIGLKDALAVCDRRSVRVTILSPHGDIRTESRAKASFSDITTLHAVITPPSDPNRVGMLVELVGVSDNDMAAAKSLFLSYAGDRVLESTKFGDVLAKREADGPGRIYYKGLLVNEEPDFLFSYNVTNPNKSLRQALNRERHNVGRAAYTERVKQILTSCRSTEVAVALAADLGQFMSGRMHDELGWKDVALHACRVLAAAEAVLFVTALQLRSAAVDYAKQDGYRIVVVPEDIAAKLSTLTDTEGRPIRDLAAYEREFNDSFEFNFVEHELSPAEEAVWDLRDAAMQLAQFAVGRPGVKEIRVSETMRLGAGGAEVVGLWDASEKRIVVRRDQLASPTAFCGTLLHEVSHAVSRTADGTLAFEQALTERLGLVASAALSDRSSRTGDR
ncbi:MAG: hypothetical protein QOJ00_582 [Actinomycetota bacterium]